MSLSGRPKGESFERPREGSPMSPPDRPKGESFEREREGNPVTPPGRPEGESPSAQREGSAVRRRIVLGALLAATAALTLWVQWSQRDTVDEAALSQPVAPVQLADRRAADAPQPGHAAELPLRLPQRQAMTSAGTVPGALFGEPAARPPAAPAQAAPPPAPPVAPPLPFSFGGRLVVEGEVAYLLNEDDRTVILRPGAAAGEFVLETADDRQLQFRHQPTGLPVVMSIER